MSGPLRWPSANITLGEFVRRMWERAVTSLNEPRDNLTPDQRRIMSEKFSPDQQRRLGWCLLGSVNTDRSEWL